MMDTTEIRAALPTDIGAISALTQKAYEPWIALTGRKPLPMQVDYAAAFAVHDFALIEQDGAIRGLLETTEAEGGLLIVNVAVEPDFHGRGFGRRLLAHAEELARSRGLSRTWLYTNKLFVRNIRLYTSVGYEVEREGALNGGVAVYMVKQLA